MGFKNFQWMPQWKKKTKQNIARHMPKIFGTLSILESLIKSSPGLIAVVQKEDPT